MERRALRRGASRPPGTLIVAACAALVLAVPAARAAEADAERLAALAREFTDPLTTLPQLFLQDAYTPENHGTDAQTNRVVGRLIVPRVPRFGLLPFVQLVRPSLFLVTVPTGKGSATRTELGDMQLFDLFVVPWPAAENGLRIGVGPTFVFPTATDKRAGQEAWQLGPALGAVYKAIPRLLLGTLIQSPIAFAHSSPEHRARNAVLFQPAVLLQILAGWYVKSADASWTLGWESGAPTVIPLSLGVGRVTVREGWPPVNVFVSGEWTAYRHNAPRVAETTLRFRHDDRVSRLASVVARILAGAKGQEARISVGIEDLYGLNSTDDRSDNDVFRTQVGVLYSMFD